jgi:hypothetical protein
LRGAERAKLLVVQHCRFARLADLAAPGQDQALLVNLGDGIDRLALIGASSGVAVGVVCAPQDGQCTAKSAAARCSTGRAAAGLDEPRDGPRQNLQQVSGELAPHLSVKRINLVL